MGCNAPENFCVAQRRIVESGSVDQNDTMLAHTERLASLDLARARFLTITLLEI